MCDIAERGEVRRTARVELSRCAAMRTAALEGGAMVKVMM